MLYDAHVLQHWRVELSSDIVPNVLRFGYEHVGKRALFTHHCTMFLDPSSLEYLMWYGDPVSMEKHRKASYKLAMITYAECIRQECAPDLWPFYMSDTDVRKTKRVLHGAAISTRLLGNMIDEMHNS